jgi:hypothetical protein
MGPYLGYYISHIKLKLLLSNLLHSLMFKCILPVNLLSDKIKRMYTRISLGTIANKARVSATRLRID